jgi:hypothetical protein
MVEVPGGFEEGAERLGGSKSGVEGLMDENVLVMCHGWGIGVR